MSQSLADNRYWRVVVVCNGSPRVAGGVKSKIALYASHARHLFQVKPHTHLYTMVCLFGWVVVQYGQQPVTRFCLRGIFLNNALHGLFPLYAELLSRFAACIAQIAIAKVAFAQMRQIDE